MQSTRRIRFAPLPDPRRQVLVTDDGDELPLLPTFATHQQQQQQPLQELSQDADSASISSTSSTSRTSSQRNSLADTSGTMTPLSTSSEETTLPLSALQPKLLQSSTKPSTWPKSKNIFLRPFKKASPSASTNSLTPTPSLDPTVTQVAPPKTFNFSTEEILTLGTINLFRTSSRDKSTSDFDQQSSWNALQRWTSTSSNTGSSSLIGSPLARSQSTQSYKSKGKPAVKASSFLSLVPSPLASSSQTNKPRAAQPLPATATASKTAPVRKHTRMLNGRVYGMKRSANQNGANPFANARDEADPEFVEWGYGGMGSVRGAHAAGGGSVWGRLQSEGRGVVVGSFAGGAAVEEDPDDGSGMGWVKRRKEMREKEQKEKEAKERLEKEAAETDSEGNATPTVNVMETDSTNVSLPSTTNSSANTASAPTPSTASTTLGEEHILRAVTVPAHLGLHRPKHARSLSRTLSLDDEHESGEPVEIAVSENPSPINEYSESDSDTESDVEESKDDEDDDDDDDEDESEEDEARRKTALGAGVEKISRHKEQDENAHPMETEATEAR